MKAGEGLARRLDIGRDAVDLADHVARPQSGALGRAAGFHGQNAKRQRRNGRPVQDGEVDVFTQPTRPAADRAARASPSKSNPYAAAVAVPLKAALVIRLVCGSRTGVNAEMAAIRVAAVR